MSLIHCPECNSQISDRATTCPHCGYPVADKETQFRVKKRNFKCPRCGCTRYFIDKVPPYIYWICYECNNSETFELMSNEEVQYFAQKKAKEEEERRKNLVCCPYCKSTNTKRLGTFGRLTHFNAVGKQWHCNNCKSNF